MYSFRLLFILIASFLFACGSDADKAEPAEPSLVDGKADGATMRDLGGVGFGEEGAQQNEIMAKGFFHSYQLEVAPGAQFKLEVSQKGTSRGFDSTLWLYGPADEDGRFTTDSGQFDDDDGWGLLSRLDEVESETGGTYLVVIGKYAGEGNYRVYAECLNDSCVPEFDPLADVCVFGETYGDIVTTNDAIVVTSKAQITSAADVSGVEADQLVLAVQNAYEEATTVEEALDVVDASEVNLHRLWDVSNGRAYVVFEYGAGGNSYGRVFEAGTTDIAANINDLDLYDCNAFWGPQRRDCASNDDCADGLRCEGRHDGVGSCIDTSFRPSGLGSQCTTGTDCPGSAGMVCAGENLGGGFCVAAWSRRTFDVESNIEIPAGGRLEIPIDVYGLATVSTDVTVSMLATNDDYENLRVTLQNPLGTSGTLFGGDASAREVSLRDEAIRAYPSDEDANGQWLLVIENPDASAPGRLYRFRMTVTSQYD